MPTYQYECPTCNTAFELKRRFEDPSLEMCIVEGCNGTPQKIISPVGVVFKGSGFYINDSKNSKGKDKTSTDSEKSSDTTEKTKEKSDSKTETTKEPATSKTEASASKDSSFNKSAKAD